MKQLNQYIKEKLIINKDYKSPYTCVPTSFDKLRKIIENRYKKLGAGTKQNPIDFNDIDVSNLHYFQNDEDKGIFEYMRFKYIDISDWDVSNVKTMRGMFFMCKELESIGDISEWDVSNVTNMSFMFNGCTSFNQDLSGWDVSKVIYTIGVFTDCPIQEEYKPKFK